MFHYLNSKSYSQKNHSENDFADPPQLLTNVFFKNACFTPFLILTTHTHKIKLKTRI